LTRGKRQCAESRNGASANVAKSFLFQYKDTDFKRASLGGKTINNSSSPFSTEQIRFLTHKTSATLSRDSKNQRELHLISDKAAGEFHQPDDVALPISGRAATQSKRGNEPETISKKATHKSRTFSRQPRRANHVECLWHFRKRDSEEYIFINELRCKSP